MRGGNYSCSICPGGNLTNRAFFTGDTVAGEITLGLTEMSSCFTEFSTRALSCLSVRRFLLISLTLLICSHVAIVCSCEPKLIALVKIENSSDERNHERRKVSSEWFAR